MQFASGTHPAPAHCLAADRAGKEVERKALDVSGNPPFTARVTFAISPPPEELVLLAKDRDGKTVEQARWEVERPGLEADAKAVGDPVVNPVDLGAILTPADLLVLGPEHLARISVAAFSAKETIPGAEVLAWFESDAAKPTKAALALPRGVRTELNLTLPSPSTASDRDTLQVALRDRRGECFGATASARCACDSFKGEPGRENHFSTLHDSRCGRGFEVALLRFSKLTSNKDEGEYDGRPAMVCFYLGSRKRRILRNPISNPTSSSRARRLAISPSTEVNLNPCPDSPAIATT